MLTDINLILSKDDEHILNITRALSSPKRLKILQLLNTSSMSVKEISDAIESPLSTTALDVTILEECGLIKVQETYTKKGKSKLCSRVCDGIQIGLYTPNEINMQKMRISLPIGSYTDYDVTPDCGIATPKHTIGLDNDVSSFFSAERFQAGLIWFTTGYLEYKISSKNLPKKIMKFSLSFEACSEAPFYRNDWKSDITVWVNDVEVGTFTSPGDFGGRNGKQNPSWWPNSLTQYGMLMNYEITNDGTFVNKNKVSNISLGDINIKQKEFITIKIGVKKESKYAGGINLFGSTFGDYAQDINVEISW